MKKSVLQRFLCSSLPVRIRPKRAVKPCDLVHWCLDVEEENHFRDFPRVAFASNALSHGRSWKIIFIHTIKQELDSFSLSIPHLKVFGFGFVFEFEFVFVLLVWFWVRIRVRDRVLVLFCSSCSCCLLHLLGMFNPTLVNGAMLSRRGAELRGYWTRELVSPRFHWRCLTALEIGIVFG